MITFSEFITIVEGKKKEKKELMKAFHAGRAISNVHDSSTPDEVHSRAKKAVKKLLSKK